MLHDATRTPGWLRPFLLFNNVMAWVSALIVLGISSWFISIYRRSSGTHVIFIEVIAALTVLLYIPGIGLTATKRYTGHYLPVHLIFSYLWLTAFIFAAEDWSQDRCEYTTFVGRCTHKHTVEAFNFLAFYFIFANVLAESIYYGFRLGRHTTADPVVHKEGPITPAPAHSHTHTATHDQYTA